MDWLSGGENKPEPKPLTLRPPSGRELELVDAQEVETKLGEDDDIYEEDDQQDEMLTGEGSGTMVSGTKTTNVLYKIEPNKFAFQQSKLQYDAADKHPELTVLGYKYAVQKIYEACAKNPEGTMAQGYA
mmetsp:Transcript_71874/g.203594  ORF Transcript_71874/g.203594 Transcript_71874/m.203594 type:complete len:129 (-) Transcript_71874:412-798(-)